MKQIQQYIKESILDDEEDVIQNNDWIAEKYLKENYNIGGSYTIKNNTINVKGNVFLNKSVTNILPEGYSFGEVTGWFDCSSQGKLESLKGCPKKTGKWFSCSYCDKLTSLEGAPQEVWGYFDCSYCEKLITLKGCPQFIKTDFVCSYCENLTSLEGAPANVGECFDCSNCKKLKSLEGSPKTVYAFMCDGCGKKFKEDYIRKITNVIRYIKN